VTVYAPLANPVNVYAPELLAVVVALAVPPSVTVVPLPPVDGLIVPEMLYVCGVAVKFNPVVILAPLTVMLTLVGLNV
jgi:hypothetical protein